MASHSPVRNRKPQAPQNPASLQARERSASPSVRDRQARSAKAQSMPAMQGYGGPGQPSQPSPTLGGGPTLGAAPQFQPGPTQIQRLLPTPPHPPVDQNGVPHPPPPQHSNSMPNVHNARGVIHPIPTRQSYGQASNDNHFQMTPGLEADIQRAHDMQQLAYGTAPASSSFPKESYMKDPVERLRASERSSPRQGAHSPEPRAHGGSHQGSPSSTKQPTIPPERRGSPAYITPMSSPGESSAYRPEFSPNSNLSRRNTVTGGPESRPMLTISNQQTPPLQSHGRMADRSLPVQEEDHDRDDDEDSGSPTPSSDLHPEGNQSRSSGSSRTHRGDETTLIGQDSEKGLTNEDEYTPRSPAADLPERTPYGPHLHGTEPLRGRARTATGDLLGLQGMDGMMSDPQANNGGNPSQYMDGRHAPKPQYHTFPAAFDPRTAARFYTPSTEDGSFLVDGPTAAYLQAILSSPRPDAPIPPTPHSQTAAPSPAPGLLSAVYDKDPVPFSPVVPAGSPYPYPFTHVRRAPYVAPPAPRDPNHPAAIQEQLARQWQVYAQNNQDAFSTTETTSSTPFQGAGFSPWALLHTTRLLGGRLPPASVQSSPSHEPIPLPPPPQGVGVRRRRRGEEDGAPAVPGPKVPRKPPPRVASTQPRETSPEPSSSEGEETAGEETAGEQDRFPVQDETRSWTNGHATPAAAPVAQAAQPEEEEDEGDWVDEEDDEEEEDLLELEFHPSYVPNLDKRKRRFDARWDALQQAFQALDRQTDSTMVLLCAPSHTTKLQSLSSRAIRRNATLREGKTLRLLRTQFSRLSAERRRVRAHSRSSSLADRLFAHVASPLTRGDGTPGADATADMREEDLRRALGTALGSLGALGSMYEQREARFKEELRRTAEERQRVELLMRQALGEGHASATGTARMPS
ncbi:hypothetical protein HDZ31DRAFT_31153 [Schizophyllum fasciatum]